MCSPEAGDWREEESVCAARSCLKVKDEPRDERRGTRGRGVTGGSGGKAPRTNMGSLLPIPRK